MSRKVAGKHEPHTYLERLVYEGAREAHARSYGQLIVIGFAIEAGARELVEKCGDLVGTRAMYVQATPDLVIGDLLKTMRSSQIFSVTGLPDVAVTRLPPEEKGEPDRYQVELRGLDIFDPTSMSRPRRGHRRPEPAYSSGPVEGQVAHIKLLKRQMYGRANFDLLRKRVLLAS